MIRSAAIVADRAVTETAHFAGSYVGHRNARRSDRRLWDIATDTHRSTPNRLLSTMTADSRSGVDHLEGYTEPTVEELEDGKLNRKLLKTYMLETARHRSATPEMD